MQPGFLKSKKSKSNPPCSILLANPDCILPIKATKATSYTLNFASSRSGLFSTSAKTGRDRTDGLRKNFNPFFMKI